MVLSKNSIFLTQENYVSTLVLNQTLVWDPGTLRKKNLNCAGIQGQIVRKKMLIVR